MANIIETGIEFNRINDIKYMRSYLMQLNDDIRYMINNIDLDNFSEEGTESYLSKEEAASNLSESVESLELALSNAAKDISAKLSQTADSIELLVSKGDVTNSINIGTDKIKISASRLHVYSDNFYLDDNTLKVNGTIIANAGEIAGFTIAKDSSGNQYLQGGTDSNISSGVLQGSKGVFKSFTCTGTFFMFKTTACLVNCRIASTGLTLEGTFNTGNIYLCHYSESTELYTNWQPLNVKGAINVTGDVHVGKNGEDDGTVTCYSIYSSIDGERPGDYEDSDIKLKEDTNLIDENEALRFINGTRPVAFRFKDSDIRQAGVIAQEVQMLQDKMKDYGLVDDSEEYLAVSYTRYVPLMAAALKEIDKKIEEIKHGSI